MTTTDRPRHRICQDCDAPPGCAEACWTEPDPPEGRRGAGEGRVETSRTVTADTAGVSGFYPRAMKGGGDDRR